MSGSLVASLTSNMVGVIRITGPKIECHSLEGVISHRDRPHIPYFLISSVNTAHSSSLIL